MSKQIVASDEIIKTNILVFHKNNQDEWQKVNQQGFDHVYEELWGPFISPRSQPAIS